MELAAFDFLVSISKEYQSRHYFSFKNISFVLLSQKGERRELIRFRANFSKKKKFSTVNKFLYFFVLITIVYD